MLNLREVEEDKKEEKSQENNFEDRRKNSTEPEHVKNTTDTLLNGTSPNRLLFRTTQKISKECTLPNNNTAQQQHDEHTTLSTDY